MAGQISAEHASVIVKAIDAIPSHLAAQFSGLVETTLVEQARHLHPGEVAKAGLVLLARIDQDGVAPREQDQQRRRDFGLRDNRDGTSSPYGRFTPELGAIWKPILDALSAPQPDPTTPRTAPSTGPWNPIRAAPGSAATTRSSRPGCGCCAPAPCPTAVAPRSPCSPTCPRQQLREQTGYATTGHGDLIPVATLLRLASEATVIPVVFDDAGGILSYGQRRRLASCGQRQALAARDNGCCFPGCTRPPAWCQAHHVIPWNLGGPTALYNLCLLCAYHHREFERRGW